MNFDKYRSKWKSKQRARALMHMIGSECAYLFDSATQDERKDVTLLIAHVESNVAPKTNACLERFTDDQLVRAPSEDVCPRVKPNHQASVYLKTLLTSLL